MPHDPRRDLRCTRKPREARGCWGRVKVRRAAPAQQRLGDPEARWEIQLTVLAALDGDDQARISRATKAAFQPRMNLVETAGGSVG